MENYLAACNQKYRDDILVRLAHHSAGIEGNTLSLPAAAAIIANDTLPAGEPARMREFYEIDNHKQAWATISHHLVNNDRLSVGIIKEIHAALTDRLQDDSGQFKQNENMILGAAFQPVSPAETPLFMTELVNNLHYRLENTAVAEYKLIAILDTHIQFERIHPFSDGNGPTGRLVLNYSLLQQGLPPLIIAKEAKARYFEFLDNQDLNGFVAFAQAALAEEQQRMKSFQDLAQEKPAYK